MRETIKKLFIFVVGAGIGVAATWQFFKNKYEKIANEEIASVKETYSKRADADDPAEEVKSNDIQHEEKKDEESTITEYVKIAGRYVTVTEAEEKGGEDMSKKPYVIKPEEFGNKDYDLISLNYHSDEVLVDEDDHPIEDIDYLVGEDSLNHFGEYEEDSVFVRNDQLKTDFEILLVEEPYYADDEDDET